MGPPAIRAALTGLARAFVVFACAAGGAAAQEAPPPAPLATGAPLLGQFRSPVLTIDADRLFGESLFGARILAEVSAATDALAAENRLIETTLQGEVDSLTARRPTMDVVDFRAAADAFDLRVQRIRQEQDAKEAGLQQALAQGREAFLAAATPVLGQLMVDSGAVVILDRRAVFLSVGLVDITAEAVAAIDAAIGDGSAPPADPGPVPPPEPAVQP